MWRAEIDGRRLRFHLTGINNQNFLMADEETGTWWQQVSGKAVQGPLRGKRLELVFHDEVSFAQWRREHPRTRVLRPDTTPGRVEGADWETEVGQMKVVTPVRPDDPLPPRELVAGVELGGEERAYPMQLLRAQSPVHDVLGGVPVVLWVAPDGRSLRVFERRAGGQELELFAPTGAPPGQSAPAVAEQGPVLVDAQTGSQWSFSGEAVAGPLAGQRLPRVYVLLDYWFDWVGYHPRTGIYRRDGAGALPNAG